MINVTIEETMTGRVASGGSGGAAGGVGPSRVRAARRAAIHEA